MDKSIRGLGLSDWEPYALRLADRFDYTNTHFDREPRLDITSAEGHKGDLDFLIASEVFEHVAPPVDRAFRNAARLLKPDGVLIFTVPFGVEPQVDTIEHFPGLHEFHIDQGEDAAPALVNTTAEGEIQRFTNLVFHGGEGMTLEMRVFARRALLAELRAAGFGYVRVVRSGSREHGVYWPHPWSLPILASPRGPSRATRRSRVPIPRAVEDRLDDLDKPSSDKGESASDASMGPAAVRGVDRDRATHLPQPEPPLPQVGLTNQLGPGAYNYKIGISFLDIGYIRFTKSARKTSYINTYTEWFKPYDTLPTNSVNEINAKVDYYFLDNSEEVIRNENFTMKIPPAMSLQYDYSIKDYLFINTTIIWGFNFGKAYVKRPSILAITPRFETARVEVSLPISMYEWNWKNPRIGFSLRYGNFFFGFDKINTILGFSDFNGFDLYAGLRLNLTNNFKMNYIKGLCGNKKLRNIEMFDYRNF